MQRWSSERERSGLKDRRSTLLEKKEWTRIEWKSHVRVQRGEQMKLEVTYFRVATGNQHAFAHESGCHGCLEEMAGGGMSHR
jgi:hypothetical protein